VEQLGCECVLCVYVRMRVCVCLCVCVRVCVRVFVCARNSLHPHHTCVHFMSSVNTTSVTSPSSPVASNGFFNMCADVETSGMRPSLGGGWGVEGRGMSSEGSSQHAHGHRGEQMEVEPGGTGMSDRWQSRAVVRHLQRPRRKALAQEWMP